LHHPGQQETVWLDDIPVAVITKATATSPTQVYFIHTDHLNTSESDRGSKQHHRLALGEHPRLRRQST